MRSLPPKFPHFYGLTHRVLSKLSKTMNENQIEKEEHGEADSLELQTINWMEIEIPESDFEEIPTHSGRTFTGYKPFPAGKVMTDELTPYETKWLFVFLKNKGDRFSLEEFLGINSENISMEDLRFLRDNNFPKPPNLIISVWTTPLNDHVTVRQRRAIDLRALGWTYSQISNELGLGEAAVRGMLLAPWAKAKVAHKQNSLFENDAKQYMKTLMNKAYGVIDEILDNPEEKSSVRLEASKFVVDHVIGKAQQTVEHKGSLLVEFMNKLDERPVSQDTEYETLSSPTSPKKTFTPDEIVEPEHYELPTDEETAALGVATAKPLLADMKSAMDTLVDSVLKGKTVTVGKRNAQGTK